MDPLDLSDTEDSIFGTNTAQAKPAPSRQEDDALEPPRRPESRYETQEAHEAALKRELENVRNVNKVIEDVVESLEKAKANMGTVSQTVTNATTLLQTWTRILSATEHNQRLLLNPAWHGATQDIADIASESAERERMAERRVVEEQMRKEAAVRKAEEDERKRAAAAAAPGRGTRGRGGTRGRAGAASSSTGTGRAYVGVGGQTGRGASRGASSSTSRASASGIGRGVRGARRGLP